MEEVQYKVVNSEIAQKLLLDLGIYPDKKGYLYLLAAIQYFRDRTKKISKIYSLVGNTFGKKAINVERCIRFSVMKAYFSSAFTKLNKCFDAEIFKKDTYLSNGDFISMIATYLDMISAPNMKVVSLDRKFE